MTNREWLESLSDEEFAIWLAKDEEIIPVDGGFLCAEPTPRLKTLKSGWTSAAVGLTHWLKEERK